MNNLTGIHWLRVLIGGFLAEVSVIAVAVVIPVFLLFGQRAVSYAALPGSLVMCFFLLCGLGDATRRFTLGVTRNSGGSCRHAFVCRFNSGPT
jgi:hypothetical protein